jgi:hypothetical protein
MNQNPQMIICIEYGCTKPKKEDSSYCRICGCSHPGCQNLKAEPSYSDTPCIEHQCVDCENMAMDHTVWCYICGCCVDRCEYRAIECGSDTPCDLHVCADEDCTRVIVIVIVIEIETKTKTKTDNNKWCALHSCNDQKSEKDEK